MSNDPYHMQTMLNKLRAYARRKSLTVNTQKSEVMWKEKKRKNYVGSETTPYID